LLMKIPPARAMTRMMTSRRTSMTRLLLDCVENKRRLQA
jgi:hypothetical protein